MEVTTCVQTAGNHAASLLVSLSLQREQARFCDCVIRQRQNPGQLHLAHRCVLAASSPVLASILSSSGALVELQIPCLSDSVLRLVLDYIYRGVLPFTQSQQQYSNLLTAACHLQMDELQETLRTKVRPPDTTNASNGPESQSYEDINNTKSTNNYLQSSSGTCSGNPLESKDQYCDNETDTCRSSNKIVTNQHSRNNASLLGNPSSSFGMSGSIGLSINTDNCRHVTYLTSHDLNQSIPFTAEVNRMSNEDKELQKDTFYSADTVIPESWQMITTEEPAKTPDNKRRLYFAHTAEVQEEEMSRKERAQQTETNREEKNTIHHSLHPSASDLEVNVSPSQYSSSHSPQYQHPRVGAVPVIRHSSAVSVAEMSSVRLFYPPSQTPVSFERVSDSGPGSTAKGRIIEGTTQLKDPCVEQGEDNRENNNQIVSQSLYCRDSIDQFAIQNIYYRSSSDQSGMLNNDCISSNVDHDMDVDLPHTIDNKDPLSYCHSPQSHTKCLKGDLIPQNADCCNFPRTLSLPSKHQQQECCHLSMATPAAQQCSPSPDPRVAVPLPVEDSDKGIDWNYVHLCPEGEAKEHRGNLSRCQAEMNKPNSHCERCGSHSNWYPNLDTAEMNTMDAASSLDKHDDKDTAMDDVTVRASLEHANTLNTEISEPHQTFTDTIMSSYHGHLHYHCIPQENMPHRDHKHSQLSHPDHSDRSSSEVEAGTFASPYIGSLRQHFSKTDQILLLDISDKPAELLVSYRRSSDERERWVTFNPKDPSGGDFLDNDREQQNVSTSPARNDEKRNGTKTKFVAESCDEIEATSWVRERDTEEIKSIGQEQRRSGDEGNAGRVDGESLTTTMTVSSSHSAPHSLQASASSMLSVCIPSDHSASMPTNVSAHLSSPVHSPFQCSLCHRSFSQRGSLNRHMRSHLGVRPFPCPCCSMTFSRQYRVTEHMRVHQRCVLGSDCQKAPAASM